MTYLIFGVIIPACIFALMFLRIEVVSRVQDKAIDHVFKQENWKELSEELLKDIHSSKQLIQLHKWTFKQFYPQYN